MPGHLLDELGQKQDVALARGMDPRQEVARLLPEVMVARVLQEDDRVGPRLRIQGRGRVVDAFRQRILGGEFWPRHRAVSLDMVPHVGRDVQDRVLDDRHAAFEETGLHRGRMAARGAPDEDHARDAQALGRGGEHGAKGLRHVAAL
ncbi:hypothetical protein HK414_14850 [Ramlibacter terrae]|uniref:Uncharacterized protein n=1 Tax=Ramlibacter terrae TaxID=2732511 RepID=A0ABX6P381_9BURK|nr:hypothetical protein HK414_14850 [Ramlibacter terrae]